MNKVQVQPVLNNHFTYSISIILGFLPGVFLERIFLGLSVMMILTVEDIARCYGMIFTEDFLGGDFERGTRVIRGVILRFNKYNNNNKGLSHMYDLRDNPWLHSWYWVMLLISLSYLIFKNCVCNLRQSM